MLGKVDKFNFPKDFIILDMDEDNEISIILGRPFLATGRTFIDVEMGELTMRVHDVLITFWVFRRVINSSSESKACFAVQEVSSGLQNSFINSRIKDTVLKNLRLLIPCLKNTFWVVPTWYQSSGPDQWSKFFIVEMLCIFSRFRNTFYV